MPVMLTDLCRRSIVDAWARSYLGNLGLTRIAHADRGCTFGGLRLTHNPSRSTVEPENGGYLGDVERAAAAGREPSTVTPWVYFTDQGEENQ